MIHKYSLLLCLFIVFTFVNGSGSLFDGYKKRDGKIDDIPSTLLSNDVDMPLIGLGVSNMQSNRIENMIYEALKSENRIRLIDSSQTSGTDKAITQGIVTGIKRFKETTKIEDRLQVHVVKKVWYTHHGYERTKVIVKESIYHLSPAFKDPNVDLKIHLLIHWPGCFDGVDGMNCELEEKELPEQISKVEPAPHLDRGNAWKGSWKALEDMYESADYPSIASIGVSNFSAEELEVLIEDVARVKPHLVQMSASSLLNDIKMIDLCKRNTIHIQLFNLMSGIITKKTPATPHAHHSLLMIGNALSKKSDMNLKVTPPQVLLKWLSQNGISTVSRTTDLDHLTEISSIEIQKVPEILGHKNEIVTEAIEAIESGADLDEDQYIKVTFYASNQDVFVYLYDESVEKQRHIAYIGKGDSFDILTHPGNIYRIYDAYNKEINHVYKVDHGGYGDHLHIPVVEL